MEDVGERGFLNESHVILIVAVGESFTGPHMAPKDQCYYIRAGAHTVPARHFIVEAIRAKRFNTKPKLTYLFRVKPGSEQVLQLGVIALTDSPAIEVSISLSPLPEHLQRHAGYFPIKLPVVDQRNPFYFDVAIYSTSEKSFGSDISLKLEYYDLLQNHYENTLPVGLESTPPMIMGNHDKKILEALNGIEKALRNLSSNSK